MRTINYLVIATFSFILAGCSDVKHNFVLVSEDQSFEQNSVEVTQRKIDILWVIDNSGSMAPFQQNLATNFSAFINDFVQKGYDFQMAVTTTDAYLAQPQFLNDFKYSLFKDGKVTPTGYPIINNLTPDIVGSFTGNALQGSGGAGDERAFSSLKAALENPGNSKFLRSNSFLAVIILSDEDDFSSPTRPVQTDSKVPGQDYNFPGLESVDSYVNFLDFKTASTSPNNRNYNVSAVAMIDANCAAAKRALGQASILSRRVIELTQKTKGVLGDICSSNYSTVLQSIQKKIIELTTEVVLNRKPRIGSIRIMINDVLLREDIENGWTYNSQNNSIVFHGEGVPPKAAKVSIVYDPAGPSKAITEL